MDLDQSSTIVKHAHRGIRWHVIGLAATLATAFLSISLAQLNPMSAIVVILSGIGVILAGRSLRAVGALIQVVQPPPPRWIASLVPVTFLIGPLISAIGAWLLLGHWRPAP
jgi:hypothetical protein